MSNNIGDKIKELRKKQKLTLKEISDQTNLSISFLSQVERTKSSLTLESLKKISEVLGVNPSYFFNDSESSSTSVVTSGKIDEDKLISNQFLYKDLSGGNRYLGFEPLLVILNPGDNKGNRFSHKGVEFIYVLEGNLTVLINEESYHLEPNDSIVIDSKNPHYWVNNTSKQVRFLCISSDKY